MLSSRKPHLSPVSVKVHVPNHCVLGSRAEVDEAELDDFLVDPEELKKDPHTCFFENQHHAHGSRWTPNYDKCFSCGCQVKAARRAPPRKRLALASNLTRVFSERSPRRSEP